MMPAGVILGKTNVRRGRRWQSYNDIYAPTNKPFDLGRTPGGSSGGSSAAARGGATAALARLDIGGSLRSGRSLAASYAHKRPTICCRYEGYDATVSSVPIDRDMAVIGPMAARRYRLSLLLDVDGGARPAGRQRCLQACAAAAAACRLKDFREAGRRGPSDMRRPTEFAAASRRLAAILQGRREGSH